MILERQEDARLAASTPTPEQVPKATFYPFFVVDDADRHRFDLSYWIAVNVYGAMPDTADAWMASRAIFNSDIRTDS
jgi:hypothetical protein